MLAFSLSFLLSITLAAYAFLSDPARPEFLPIAGLLAVVGLLFWLRALGRALRPGRAWIVIDGSNVMHWADGPPSLDPVAAVLSGVDERGLLPLVWFDANVGYKVADRYLGPDRLARRLRLDRRQVRVAPKGTPADPLLLDDARVLGARVVTNDRFRDWAESHPQVMEAGFLVRGRLRTGKVELDFGNHEGDRAAKV